MQDLFRNFPKFAVVGGGNGGLATAGYLASMGYHVNLFNRSPDKIRDILNNKKIILEGAIQAEGCVDIATSNMQEAVEDVDIVMVVVPASAHRQIAREMSPYLKDGQIVILNPGRTGGALEFRNTLHETGNKSRITVAEAQTLLYACRKTGNQRVNIFSIKERVAIAAIPATRTQKIIKMLSQAFPQFYSARNVLETSFNNIGAIFHPAPTLLNAGRIETTGGDFEYYIEGISPTVARILEEMDCERIRVAETLGVKAISAIKWLEQSYNAVDESLYGAIQKTVAYKGIKSPATVNNRYIFEDVPVSLVPISSIGKMFGIPTPTIDSIIQLACAAQDEDYWEIGRTVETLGLSGKSAKEINRLVMEEEIDIMDDSEGVVA
ncbi:MAG: NAD/NADP octopine/nopaline dehydrogenase [Firmicutes bacterium]|nr:NAD/NADP octopine/nopaline dehydrogenase [Bacillota bacterium]MDI6707057.1 NAD/NADP octopine/nopaline dehydrogenase family protein [Bacillota bacterium]